MLNTYFRCRIYFIQLCTINSNAERLIASSVQERLITLEYNNKVNQSYPTAKSHEKNTQNLHT